MIDRRKAFSRQFVVCVLFSWVGTGTVLMADVSKSIQNTPKKMTIPKAGVEVPIGTDDAQVLLHVSINGAGPFTMLLDTGIANVVLDDGVVSRAKLSVLGAVRFEDRSLIAADAANLVQLNQLAIGEAVFEGLSAMVVDLNLQLGRARGLDGIVGLSALTGSLVTVDYPRQVLRIENGALPSSNGRDVFDMKTGEHWPMIELTVGEKKLAVGIDSTSRPALTVGGRDRFSVSLSAPPVTDRADRILSDIDVSYSHVNGDIALGKYSLVHAPAALLKDPSRLGYDSLRFFAITFDSKHSRIRFSREGDSRVQVAPKSRFGLVLKRVSKALEIVHIIPGSPADVGHLAVGDRVISVDGKEAMWIRDNDLVGLLRTKDSLLIKVDKGGAHLHVVLDAQ